MALLLGAWDSHNDKKQPIRRRRALVSEIFGWNAQSPSKVPLAVRAGSRLDPHDIPNALNHLRKSPPGTPSRWIYDESLGWSRKDEGYGKEHKGRPAGAGYGNIAPTLSNAGVVLTHARQHVVLSLNVLRQYHFGETPEASLAGQTLLAALALALLSNQPVTDGYSLRSGCDLVPETLGDWQVVGPTLDPQDPFHLTPKDALALFNQALSEAEKHGIVWASKPIELIPNAQTVALLGAAQNAAPAEDEAVEE